jgi:phosphonate transport system ATP-binding protein
MLRLLTDLTTSAGKTLIVSLHSPYLIQRYFSRVIGLREGQLFFGLPASDVTETVLDRLYDLNHDRPEELVPEVSSAAS